MRDWPVFLQAAERLLAPEPARLIRQRWEDTHD